jgi:uncharacterized membrane protein YhaH (DUF805 family)
MLHYLHKRLDFLSWFVLAVVIGYVALTLQHTFVCQQVQHDEHTCGVCTLIHTITNNTTVRISLLTFFVLLAVIIREYTLVLSVQRYAANLNKAPPHS